MHSATQADTAARNVDPNRLLYSLMIPAIIMPLGGWMFTVSLPIIRDDFGISAELAAWIFTAFSLPFMILMPVFGRISDGLGKRRLLLFGIALFGVGNLMATLSTDLSSLMIARILQGIGGSSILPLSLALITEVFKPEQRGNAMGRYSTIGPITGVVGPVLAGFIVASFGWRISFIPPFIISIIAFVVVYKTIPSSIARIRFDFLRQFDWLGVILLAVVMTLLLFYFSSKPITGVDAFRDWRLLLGVILALLGFIWHEGQRDNPFLNLSLFRYPSLVVASTGAMLRMMALSGCLGFLMPLYLADIVGLNPTLSGFFLLLNPAAMVVVVQLAGRFSDRFGSRLIVIIGFTMLAAFMLTFTQLPMNTPRGVLVGLLLFFGLGAGIMLASLHRAALNDVAESDLGGASGVYSMIRFLGSASGAAFGGVLLQQGLDSGRSELAAYQFVFLCYAGFAIAGILIGALLPKSSVN